MRGAVYIIPTEGSVVLISRALFYLTGLFIKDHAQQLNAADLSYNNHFHLHSIARKYLSQIHSSSAIHSNKLHISHIIKDKHMYMHYYKTIILQSINGLYANLFVIAIIKQSRICCRRAKQLM